MHIKPSFEVVTVIMWFINQNQWLQTQVHLSHQMRSPSKATNEGICPISIKNWTEWIYGTSKLYLRVKAEQRYITIEVQIEV